MPISKIEETYNTEYKTIDFKKVFIVTIIITFILIGMGMKDENNSNKRGTSQTNNATEQHETTETVILSEKEQFVADATKWFSNEAAVSTYDLLTEMGFSEIEYEDIAEGAMKVLVGLCFEGGLRVSEVIGLQLEDLKEIHKCKIKIKNHNDLSNRDSAVKYDSEGTIFITERLQQDIITYINEVLVDIDTNYFLLTFSGDNKYKPMTRRNIEKMFSTLGKKVGIEGLHPHALRHGLAVDMLSKGCPMVQIKDTLRHQNLATTSDIYADYDNEKKQELVDEYQQKVSSITKTNLDELADFLIEDEKEDF